MYCLFIYYSEVPFFRLSNVFHLGFILALSTKERYMMIFFSPKLLPISLTPFSTSHVDLRASFAHINFTIRCNNHTHSYVILFLAVSFSMGFSWGERILVLVYFYSFGHICFVEPTNIILFIYCSLIIF